MSGLESEKKRKKKKKEDFSARKMRQNAKGVSVGLIRRITPEVNVETRRPQTYNSNCSVNSSWWRNHHDYTNTLVQAGSPPPLLRPITKGHDPSSGESLIGESSRGMSALEERPVLYCSLLSLPVYGISAGRADFQTSDEPVR